MTQYISQDVNEEELIEVINKANEANRMNYRYVDLDDALTKLGLMKKKLNNAGYYLFSKNKPLLVAIFATDERISFNTYISFSNISVHIEN